MRTCSFLMFGLCVLLALSGVAQAQYAGWWHFDEGTGLVAADSSGNGNNGALAVSPHTPAWIFPGRFNSALSFSNLPSDPAGLGTWVIVPDSNTLSPGAQVTIEAWIKPTTLLGDAMVAGKWNDLNGEYELQIWGSQVKFFARPGQVGGGDAGFTVATSAPITAGVWHHIAGAYNGASMQVYVDGLPSGAAVPASGAIPSTAAPFTIGAQRWSPVFWRPFNGVIDEVRVWNQGLSAAYILKLYQLQSLNFSKTITGASTVLISATTPSTFSYRIDITGTAPDLSNLAFFDVVPAEFDLISAIPTGACTVNATQPPGASKGPGPKLEPEILQLILTSPFSGSCSVAVTVVTDQNPASAKGNKGLQYEPTTCPASGKIALNDGIQVFDITDPSHPFLLLGPISPLSLSCTP